MVNEKIKIEQKKKQNNYTLIPYNVSHLSITKILD